MISNRIATNVPHKGPNWLLVGGGIIILTLIFIFILYSPKSIETVQIKDGSTEVIMKNPFDANRSNVKALAVWTSAPKKCKVTVEFFISQFSPQERWQQNMDFEELNNKACTKQFLLDVFSKVKNLTAKFPAAKMYADLLDMLITKIK